MNRPSMTDRPFACPPDIVLDLPVPPSVNRTRRSHGPGIRLVNEWAKRADMMVMARRRPIMRGEWQLQGRFEIEITVSERCRSDLDNLPKSLIDYLRRIKIVRNDSPKYMRKVTLQWGDAPEGVRVTVRPVLPSAEEISASCKRLGKSADAAFRKHVVEV